jgi:phosphotransferase system HPr (HPr) family protein
MITVDATFRDRYGLHPRSAMRIQQTAAGFTAKLTIEGLDTGTAPIPASTMIGLVSAGIRNGERVRITADGPDETAAAEALRSLLEAGVCHP